MKINQILTERVGAALAYKNMSPLHVGILKRIANNSFDVDNAKPSSVEIYDDLVNNGLVDEFSGDVTEDGLQALHYANKYGSFERRHQSKRGDVNKLRNDENSFDDLYDEDESYYPQNRFGIE